MSREERIEELFAAALEHESEARTAFVEAQTLDADEREELLRLLASQVRLEAAPVFLERPLARIDPDAIEDIRAKGEPPDLLPEIEGFELLDVLGRGGMGVVYRAEQHQPRRLVALKVIDPRHSDALLLRRFEREAEVLGRLEHPGIARLYQTGSAQGWAGPQPWIAMELVDGLPLLEYAHARQLGRRERVELLGRVAEAVHHAHTRGIVHRDLKPANVMVVDAPSTRSRDTPSGSGGAYPKVLDFGVARLLEGADSDVSQYTEPGRLVGTLSCMSPEQCRSGDAVDERTDVYALGVLAFELLGGQRPYELSGRSLQDAVRVIQETDAPLLGSLDTGLRGDLETIVAHAMEKEPARRYPSAAELGADLHRYLRDEPIVARPASTLDRVRKFCRRHRVLVAATSIVIAVLLLAMVGIGNEARRARRAESDARAERDQALLAQDDLRSALALLEEILLTASPYQFRGEGEATVREVLELATARPGFADRTRPRARAHLARTLGRVFFELRLHEQAIQWYEQAWLSSVAVDGESSLDAVTVAASLSRALATIDRADEAQTLLKERVQPYVAQHAEVPELQHVVRLAEAQVALHSRRLGEAVDRARGLLEFDVAVFGDSAAISEARGLLIRTLLENGDWLEALGLAEELLANRREAYGPEHPRTLSAHADVLAARLGEGQLEDVAAAARELLADIERLGPRDPDRVHHLVLAGRVLREAGELEAAGAALEEAVASATLVYGTDGHSTVNARVSRVVLWLDMDRPDAVAELEDLYRIAMARWPLSFLATSIAANLARAREQAGDAVGAIDLHRQAVLGFRRDAGPNHPNTLTAQSNFAASLLSLGRAEEALPILEEVYAARCESFGAQHMESMVEGNNLAVTLKRLGRLEEAEALFARLAQFSTEIYEPSHPMRGVSRLTWGICLQEMNRHADAAPLFEEALACFQGALPRGHRYRVRTLEALKASAEARGDAADLAAAMSQLERE